MWDEGLQGRGLRRKPGSVRKCENEQSHSQVNSYFGSWSLDGVLSFHRAIARVKTHHIEELFISLEIY
jgi:hypothetical protein